jgi:hypothetical protein
MEGQNSKLSGSAWLARRLATKRKFKRFCGGKQMLRICQYGQTATVVALCYPDTQFRADAAWLTGNQCQMRPNGH